MLTLAAATAMSDSCDRNFAEVCPEGWTQEGDSLRCSPPASYKGPCDTQNFAGFNFMTFQYLPENAVLFQQFLSLLSMSCNHNQ